jgi:nitrogen-specific signal transduction histidine kinase
VAEVREALSCIVDDTDRASDVVDRIGSLIKKAPARKEVVDLNAAILEVTALTRSEAVKTGVTVGTQLAGELPRIQGDTGATATSDVELDCQCHPVDEWR